MDRERQKACSQKGGGGKRRGILKCEVAITTAEAAAKFKGIGITLKISRAMEKQDGAKGFGIISSEGKSFQGGSPPFLPSRVQGGRWQCHDLPLHFLGSHF